MPRDAYHPSFDYRQTLIPPYELNRYDFIPHGKHQNNKRVFPIAKESGFAGENSVTERG